MPIIPKSWQSWFTHSPPFAPPRHSCEGRNPQGKGGGASFPSFPNHGNHGSPTLPPSRPPTPSPENRNPKGKGGGASCPSFPNHGNHGSPTLPPSHHPRHSCEGRNPQGKGGASCPSFPNHGNHGSPTSPPFAKPRHPEAHHHVIPAKAGIHRARARAAVHHAHHSQIMAIMVHPLSPFAPPTSFLRRQESTAQGWRCIMPIIPKSWQSWFTHTSPPFAKPRHSERSEESPPFASRKGVRGMLR